MSESFYIVPEQMHNCLLETAYRHRGYHADEAADAARFSAFAAWRGKTPALGTNPHSSGFPTTDAVGFSIVIDWATSTVAMGRVQQLNREGKALPPNAAVDQDGNPTIDPNEAVALLSFGAHKGYGLGLINELVAAFIGGLLPTIRCRAAGGNDEKYTPAFFFQCIHPDALSSGAFAKGRDQAANIKAVVRDILGHGNEKCLLPGQPEANAAQRSTKRGGLLFTKAEIEAFNEIAYEGGETPWDLRSFKTTV